MRYRIKNSQRCGKEQPWYRIVLVVKTKYTFKGID
jgi:hypothetical protein